MSLLQAMLVIGVGLATTWLYFRLPVSDHPVSILLNGLSGLCWAAEHDGCATPAAVITDDMRYTGVQPPPSSGNLHGEIEYLDGDIPVTHWFEQAGESIYHFVTAGDPADEVVVIVPGLPESWWAFHHQIADLSRDYYVIAVDMKGFGQSDKRLHLNYTNSVMAQEIATLLNRLGVETFNLMGHDRGAVLTDHMTHVPALQGRIVRYVRMQQSFNEPHGEPVPPHFLLKTWFGRALFRSHNFVPVVYQGWFESDLSPSDIKRLKYEFTFRGTAAAICKYFETTNFDIELADRHNFLFDSMTMPMLILQALYDKGQHPEEYDRSPEFVWDARVQFIHSNHFLHLENPRATNRAIRRFFAETNGKKPAPEVTKGARAAAQLAL